MDNTTSEPDIGPPSLTLSDRLRRMRAVVNTLRDSFELAGYTHSGHLADRVEVCDWLSEELGAVAGELERG